MALNRITKITLSTLTGITLLGIAGVVFLWIWTFDPFVQPPKIAQELPSSFIEADRVFKDRVADAFKPGMAERDLVAKLLAQGFTVKPEQTAATFEKSHFPCQLHWQIHWRSEQERVTKIEAAYFGSCL